MEITIRQKDLLGKIVKEYIKSARPVSSKLLEKKYKLSISPATIRIEMQDLTREGFLFQPHTSAGRVPTDKGYRFFVDTLLEKGFFKKDFDLKISSWIEKEIKDTIQFIQSLTKDLAFFSSNLALSYLSDEKILWREGWVKILQKPEFREKKLVSDFAELLRNFEEEIKDLKVNSGIQVYIGKENFLPKAKNFSIIISKCYFPKKKRGILAILGPKRMDYNKNISLLSFCTRLLEQF